MNFLKTYRWELLGGAALLGAAAVGVTLWLVRPADPHAARARDLLEKVAQAGQLAPEEFQRYQQELQQELRLLTPEVRRKLLNERRELRSQFTVMKADHTQSLSERREMTHRRLDRFFSLSEKKRLAFLDSEIDQLEEARRQGDALKTQAMVTRLKGVADWAAPEDRKLAAKFCRAVDERIKERGLAPIE
jgi:hypothetical protein